MSESADAQLDSSAPSPSGAGYDAFVSYSHEADRELARTLQRAAERWGSVLPGRRRLRIFRDESNLSANPDLWGSIREALDASRCFVLLASPESTDSPWVAKEVAHYVERNGSERLCIALTRGSLPWLDAGAHDDARPAVSEEVARLLPETPNVVDLRAFRERAAGPAFDSQVASLVASILGKNKDEVFGEHIRAQRRFIASLISAGAVLVAALVIAGWQYLQAEAQRRVADEQRAVAEGQRAEADRQRELAEEQRLEADRQRDRAFAEARRANSRRLAAEADLIAESRLDTALLVLGQSYLLDDNSAVRNRWLGLLAERALPAAYLSRQARGMGFQADGALVVRTSEGTRVFTHSEAGWRPASPERITAPDDPIWSWSGACDDDGEVCECRAWETATSDPYGEQESECTDSLVRIPDWCAGAAVPVPGAQVELELRRGGRLESRSDAGFAIYLCDEAEPGGPRPFLRAGSAGMLSEEIRSRLPTAPPPLQFARDVEGGWLALARSDGQVEVWPMHDGLPVPTRMEVQPLELEAPVQRVAAARGAEALAVVTWSKDGGSEGSVRVWRDLERASNGHRADFTAPLPWFEVRNSGVLALSEDASRVAAGIDVQLSIWETSGSPPVSQPAYLGRHNAISADLSGDLLAVIPRSKVGADPVGTWFFDLAVAGEPKRLPGDPQAVRLHSTDPVLLLLGGPTGLFVGSGAASAPRRPLDEGVEALATDSERRIGIALADGSLGYLADADADRIERSIPRSKPTRALALLGGDEGLVRASESGLEIWRWPTDAWITISDAPHEGVASTPGGAVVALSGGEVRIYRLDPAHLLARTCALVGRNLSADEWRQHVGDELAYQCTCAGLPPGQGIAADACSARSDEDEAEAAEAGA